MTVPLGPRSHLPETEIPVPRPQTTKILQKTRKTQNAERSPSRRLVLTRVWFWVRFCGLSLGGFSGFRLRN
jgi:hypothetical protein